jgi:hypothetical protein
LKTLDDRFDGLTSSIRIGSTRISNMSPRMVATLD